MSERPEPKLTQGQVVFLRKAGSHETDEGDMIELAAGREGYVSAVRPCESWPRVHAPGEYDQGPWLYDVEFSTASKNGASVVWLIVDAGDLDTITTERAT